MHWKEGGVGRVESTKVSWVIEPDVDLHDIIECAAGFFQNSFDVAKDLRRLCLDSSINEATVVIECDLTRDKNEIARAHCF